MRHLSTARIILVLAALLLAACDDSGVFMGGAAGAGSGSTGTVDGSTLVFQIGHTEGGRFQVGRIRAGQSTLSAAGTTGLKVEVVDGQGNPITDGSAIDGFQLGDVEFSSRCFEDGKAIFSDVTTQAPTTTVSLSNGVARITYTAGNGCEGVDDVSARVVISLAATEESPEPTTIGLTATAKITILQASVGSLEFESAIPRTMGLSGAGLREASNVAFVVRDPNGSPIAGRTVNFALSSTVGGLRLDEASAVSDQNGLVRAIVRSGTVHIGVRVTASTVDPVSGVELFSQSEELLVSSLLADQKTFSIAVDRLNWHGCNFDGVSYKFSARAADRFNNPVPKGTVIAFTSEAGSVFEDLGTEEFGDSPAEAFPGGCRTAADGSCAVVLRTQGQRPDRCRVTVLAYTTGEESFLDNNGNGLYDDGESFDDLSEPFLDADEDGIFDSDEETIDFNQNGLRDAPDGKFSGLLCKGMNCTAENATINVADELVVVWSTGIPVFERITVGSDALSGSPRVLGAGSEPVTYLGEGGAFITFLVRDQNQQPLPVGTTFTLTSEVAQVAPPGFDTQLNSNNDSEAANSHSFFVSGSDGSECDAGVMTFTVAVPADDEAGIGAGSFAINVPEYFYPTPVITVTALTETIIEGQELPIRFSLACPHFEDIVLDLAVFPASGTNAPTLSETRLTIRAGQVSATSNLITTDDTVVGDVPSAFVLVTGASILVDELESAQIEIKIEDADKPAGP